MGTLSVRFSILILAIVINSILAFVVYKNNSKSATSKIFAFLSVVTTLWLVDMYLSVTPAYIQHSLLWVRLSILLAAPQIILFFLLAHTLPGDKLLLRRSYLYCLLVVTTLVIADAVSPFAFTRVEISQNQVEAVPGPGLALFVLFAISLSLGAIYILFKKLSQSSGYLKEQYRYVVLGLILMLGLLTTTILIPVALLKSSRFVPLVPLYTIAFLGCTTYAIVKKRLFDIRIVIARSVAYLLLLATLTGIYVGSVFGLSDILLRNTRVSITQNIVSAILVLVLVFIFQPLKKFFDRLTNKIFYRDAYDPQAFLDELNAVFVTRIELNNLLEESAKIISRNIRAEHCIFGINATKLIPVRAFGGSTHFPLADITGILEETSKSRKKVIDVSEASGTRSRLHDLMKNNSSALLVHLATHTGSLGYMVLGDKQSGNLYSHQDIKMLDIIADELAIAIQNALRFEEIQQFNVTLRQRVEEATKELKVANERLKALDTAKDEFISMASHQLRTPLTTVKGYLSMVLEGDAGSINKNQKDLVKRSFDGAQRMVYLISDLLNVSRLQTGKFVIENKLTNLSEVVSTELNQLKDTAKARHITLTYKKPANFPWLMLDETKIRQVIMNFLDNAIYYTPVGGKIVTSLEATDKDITYTVTDTGIGVPKDDQHRLFAKFYRTDNARKTRPDGTGLGLFMAKKVITAQGGDIVFKSIEGQGSTFGFTFPRDKVEIRK